MRELDETAYAGILRAAGVEPPASRLMSPARPSTRNAGHVGMRGWAGIGLAVLAMDAPTPAADGASVQQHARVSVAPGQSSLGHLSGSRR